MATGSIASARRPRELMRMINDILAFAKLESGRVEVRPVPLTVQAAVARAESLIRLRMRKRGWYFSS